MEQLTTGERIYLLRSKMRLSQNEFGKAIGIYGQNVSAWERNTRTPGMEACAKMIKLAKLYGIEIDYSYLRPEFT